ncbi:MAG: hypothetical protein O7G32_07890 [SAR324 cluster bacterium]|nr:hypothetical protein [SAR324 cluster bacterium]
MTKSVQNSTQGSESRHSASALEFAFDARHKSIVRGVFALESRRLKRLFAKKPEVSLHQMESSLNDSVSVAELRKLIPHFIKFYTRDAEHAHQYFEALGRLLLEAASKERGDNDRQWFLLTQCLEMLQLAIQKSPKTLSVAAQSIIVAVCRIMGGPYREHYHYEKEIHKEMMTMLNVKKDPNDFASRDKIIKLYLQLHSYYEALVHLAEYEKIMKIKSRSLYRQKQGEIAYRKAGIFQAMVDFYYALAMNKGDDDSNKIAEMAKLNGFIMRFNRDNKRINIAPLKDLDVFSLNRTIKSMAAIANNFYTDATKSEHFQAGHKAFYFMAHNNWQFDNPKGAQQNLADGVRLLDLSRMSPSQMVSEKLRLMEFQHKIFSELGRQRKADELFQDMAKLRRERRNEPLASSA